MFKNHPKGLMTLFFTELWERFGFYILMAILVLYMDKQFNWSDSLKGSYYGFFLAAVYIFPLLGGWLGDKLFGQINTVKWGAGLMAVGYVALGLSAADRIPFFIAGLFLIALGTGIFKVNMAVLVGNLYRDRPKQRDAGFNIYYMGVNVGAAIAPLAATVIGYYLNEYRVCFWAAALGLIICLVTFEKGKKHFLSRDTRLNRDAATEAGNSERAVDGSDREVTQRIVTLIILFIIAAFFWVAFYQNGFALTLFAERSTIESDILRPETYQFFNPFFILLLTPLLLTFFSKLNRRGKEPETPVKILIGMLIMGIAMGVMIYGSLSGGNQDLNIMSPLWLISTYFVVTIAEILISPMGLSFVSKVAPARIQGLMMGGWFAATSIGSLGSGLLGKSYSKFAHHEYFILLTAMMGMSAVLVAIFLKRLKRFSA